MEIVINTEDSVPIFTQLIEQIKGAVQSGQLVPGVALPSIRQLANDLELNHNTVAKAYRLLERDGIIEAKGYRGTFIHKNAIDNCNVDLKKWASDKLSQTIAVLRESGVTDSEIRIVFSSIMKNKKN